MINTAPSSTRELSFVSKRREKLRNDLITRLGISVLLCYGEEFGNCNNDNRKLIILILRFRFQINFLRKVQHTSKYSIIWLQCWLIQLVK